MFKKFKVRRSHVLIFAGIIIIGVMIWLWLAFSSNQKNWPQSFGYGKIATNEEIAALDIDVRPDGKGLPPGSGTVELGEAIYINKCAPCHGADGKEIKGVKLFGPPLVTGKSKAKTTGNYWPYATTLFDYIRRAMPYNAPGSLTNDEVYSLSAWLLSANKVIKPGEVMNAQTLPKVLIPMKAIISLFVKTICMVHKIS